MDCEGAHLALSMAFSSCSFIHSHPLLPLFQPPLLFSVKARRPKWKINRVHTQLTSVEKNSRSEKSGGVYDPKQGWWMTPQSLSLSLPMWACRKISSHWPLASESVGRLCMCEWTEFRGSRKSVVWMCLALFCNMVWKNLFCLAYSLQKGWIMENKQLLCL